MKIGAWIHAHDELDLDSQIEMAAQNGLTTIRSDGYEYAEKAAPNLLAQGMSLLGGIHVDSDAALSFWGGILRTNNAVAGLPVRGVAERARKAHHTHRWRVSSACRRGWAG